MEPYPLVLEFLAKNAGATHVFPMMKPCMYRRRFPDDTYSKYVEFEWSNDLESKIDSLRHNNPNPEVVQRLGELLRDFLEQMGGWSREEAELTAAVEKKRLVVVTIRSDAPELYRLPWELITLKRTALRLGAFPGVLLRYEWPGNKTAQPPKLSTPPPEGGRVLFAYSHAGGHVHADEQRTGIKAACDEGDVDFTELPNVSSQKLIHELKEARNRDQPVKVLHILCHGVKVDSHFVLMIDPDQPGARPGVDAADLANRLAPYADMVQLVVLTACNSANSGDPGNHLGSVAQEIHRAGIAAVVASRYPLSIPGAAEFTRVFYRELLVTPCSVEQAFLRARDRLVQRNRNSFEWAGVQLFARAADGYDTRPVVIRPYQGLLPLGPKQHRFFFGRKKEADEVIEDLDALVENKKRIS